MPCSAPAMAVGIFMVEPGVKARDGAVGERGELLVGVVSRSSVLRRDARDEVVGVVVRHGGHGEHLAGVDVHDHAGGAAGVAQGVFQQILDAGVDGELDLGADAGFGVIRHADGAAFFVLDDGFASFRTAQDVVHGGLHAGDALFIADVVVEDAGVALSGMSPFSHCLR